MIKESQLNVVHGAAHLEVNASHFDDGDAVEEDIAVDAEVVFGSSQSPKIQQHCHHADLVYGCSMLKLCEIEYYQFLTK